MARLQRLCNDLKGTEISLILGYMKICALQEQKSSTENQILSDGLNDCLEAVWEDALHLFCNLRSPTTSSKRSLVLQMLQHIWRRAVRLLSDRENHIPKLTLSSPLTAPRREGETFQHLEQDLQAHISQLDVERQYAESGVGASKKPDLLGDIEWAQGNVVRLCLLHAFQKVAPFHSGSQADATIRDYTRRMSHMVCHRTEF